MLNPGYKPSQLFALRLGALREARLLLRKKVTTHAMSSGAAGPTQPHGLLAFWRVMKYSALAIAGTGVSLAALVSTPVGLQGLLTFMNTQIPGRVSAAKAGFSVDVSQGTAGLWIHDLRLTEPSSLGGQTLLEGANVTWQAKPLQLLTGNVGSVTISGATLTGGYSASGRDFRIIRYMEVARLLEAPPPKGDPLSHDPHHDVSHDQNMHHQAHNGDNSTSSKNALPTSSKAESSTESRSDQGSSNANRSSHDTSVARGYKKTAAVGEKGSKHEEQQEGAWLATQQQREGRVRHEISQKDEQAVHEHQHSQQQKQSGRGSSRDVSTSSNDDTGMATQASDTEAAASEVAAQQGGEFMRVLCTTNSSIDITAEFREPGLCLKLKDSKMKVSEDMRHILGGAVHIAGAFGHDHLTWLHEHHLKTLPHALSACSTRPAEGELQSRDAGNSNALGTATVAGGIPDDMQGTSTAETTTQPSTNHSFSRDLKGTSSGDSRAPAITAAAAKSAEVWWQGMPTSQEPAKKLQIVMDERGTKYCVPGEWRVVSPTLHMTARVWEVSAPGLDTLGYPTRSFTLLHQPAAMSLAFTPALGRFGLTAVNPLLGRVSSLREGSAGRMQAVLVPDGWLLPYTSASMYVEPMCLQLGASPLLSELVTGLRVLGVTSGVSSLLRKAIKTSAKSSAVALSETIHGDGYQGHKTSHEGHDDAQRDRHVSAAGLLEAWLSGMHVRIERDGVIQQKRVDMLLGPAGMQEAVQGRDVKAAKEALQSALHIALWGQADPDTDEIDFVVGLPSELLQRMGIKSLPDNYCLPIRLVGSMDNPRLELQGLSSRLKQMLLRHAAHHTKHAQQQHQEDSQPKQSSKSGVPSTDAHTAPDGPAVHTEEHTKAADDDQHQHSADTHDESGLPGVSKVKKAVKAVKWVWDVSMRLLAPSQSSLQAIEQEIQEDTASVPVQNCAVPWAAAVGGSG